MLKSGSQKERALLGSTSEEKCGPLSEFLAAVHKFYIFIVDASAIMFSDT